MKKLFLITLAVLMVASVAFGAIGGSYYVLWPNLGASYNQGALADSLLTEWNSKAYAINLTEYGPGIADIGIFAEVSVTDADIDSVSYFFRTSADGVNWKIIASDVNTSAAAGSAAANINTVIGIDSTLQYVQLLARVVGYAASGNAIQPITLTPQIKFINGTGEVIRWYGGVQVPLSYIER